MKLYKLAALVYADLMLIRNAKWRSFEYFYFPLTTVLIWGMFSLWTGNVAEAGLLLLVTNIIWTFAYHAQSHVNMQINEDSWSGSIKQVIASGVGATEYILARVVSAIIMALFVIVFMVAMAVTLFHANIFIVQWQTFALIILATLVASLGLAIFVAAGMIALGREYGFMAWTILQVFILLSAPFFPISVYPEVVRPVVMVMPYTSIFEATRGAVAGTAVDGLILNGLLVAFGYLIVSFPFYLYIFRKGLERGWLARLG